MAHEFSQLLWFWRNYQERVLEGLFRIVWYFTGWITRRRWKKVLIPKPGHVPNKDFSGLQDSEALVLQFDTNKMLSVVFVGTLDGRSCDSLKWNVSLFQYPPNHVPSLKCFNFFASIISTALSSQFALFQFLHLDIVLWMARET